MVIRSIASFYGIDLDPEQGERRIDRPSPTPAQDELPTTPSFSPAVLVATSADELSTPDPLVSDGPSTVSAHGGRNGAFDVRGASLAGSLHRYRGVPREDAFGVRPGVGGGVVAAVADGLGDPRATHAWLGAQFACDISLELMTKAWIGSGALPNTLDASELSTQMVEHAGRTKEPPTQDTALSTTLTCMALEDSGDYALFSVGDSSALVLGCTGWRELLDGASDGILNDTGDALPWNTGPVATQLGRLEPDDKVVVLATDGLADAILDPRCSSRFAAWWQEAPSVELFVAQMSFIKKGESDDRTGLAVWPTRTAQQ